MTWVFIETPYPDIEDDMWDHTENDYHIQCCEDGTYALWHDEIVDYDSENGYTYNYTLIREFDDLQKAMDYVDKNPDSPKNA